MLKQLFDTVKETNTPIFLDIFSNSEDVFNNYCVPATERESYQILFAAYEYEDYSGYSSVYYFNRNDGEYYEVYGSHCSCYGLEEQWKPEKICFPELEKRMKGKFFGISF